MTQMSCPLPQDTADSYRVTLSNNAITFTTEYVTVVRFNPLCYTCVTNIADPTCTRKVRHEGGNGLRGNVLIYTPLKGIKRQHRGQMSQNIQNCKSIRNTTSQAN